MIRSINKGNCPTIREAVQRALEASPELQSLGLTSKAGSIRFDETRCTLKVELALQDAAPESEQDYIDYCSEFGLQREWLKQRFRHGGEVKKIVGLKPRRHKYPVLVSYAGKTYKCTSEGARAIAQEGRLIN